ncbi:hypothetical protein JNB91_29940 [Rhizobium wenxiniae]|uniref:hypothetical protein n=1 Tax=Rhizobium wenxiniae TaxID=1737357 RepID=UPI001C6E83BF|nr:hypothetical protein [Rhizobium wenxiniae]MBW9091985.1 hypothetical protein [Rhizobium wenxiniae]
MADQKSEPKNYFPAPMVSKRQDRSGVRNLDEVDMSKDGVQGGVAVSKGLASTFVSKLSEDGSGDT